MAPINNTRVVRAKYIAKGDSFTNENFKTETVPVDTNLNDGEILLRNLYLGLDPYQGAQASTLNKVVAGFGVSEVVVSKNPSFSVSSIVTGLGIGWEQYTRIANPSIMFVIPEARNTKVPLTEYLNALGANGLTAFAAVDTLVKFKKDQVVFVTSAAGPVGAFIAILAKRAGAFVIGSAGSDTKVNYLVQELGLDAAINYKTQDTAAQLSTLAPDGIDIYFDLVGGEVLDIAFEKLKVKGQVVAIGNIAVVNSKTPYSNKNLHLIITKALTINGFTAFHHMHRFPDLWREFEPLIARGEIKSQNHTLIEGVKHAGQAFGDYMDGKYHGKVIVQVATL
ncbi:hypothetical protein BG011_008215 [Mortierella polycephala]|uniref:Enoyl reductase (ER) domain-containing protein n=1 Tax=Mortierella polycephala TaxID=41804 RepID=A0A9P6PNE8_9FUNG|nr:hypothetical protein BG011_008215 [Mortierella polycephala]